MANLGIVKSDISTGVLTSGDPGHANITLVSPDGELALFNPDAYESYSITSSYNSFCDSFTFKMVDHTIDVGLGWQVLMSIGDAERFLTGIIQRRTRTLSKTDRSLSFTGKDIGSKLVEGYINTAKDYNNKTPMYIIDELVGYTDYFTKPKTITSLSDSTGFSDPDDLTARNTAVQADADASKTISQATAQIVYSQEFKDLSAIANFKTSIGDTVFNKIVELVTITGFEIYQEGGFIYIGDRSKKRENEPHRVSYTINCYPADHPKSNLNNVLSVNFVEDISDRYSSVQVSSQSETGHGSNFVVDTKVATDSTLPNPKFFAQNMNVRDDTSGLIIGPEKVAIQIREQQRMDGYQLSYKVSGHVADNGSRWIVNHVVHVMDEINNINDDLMIYGVTYLFSQKEGHTTELTLSVPKSNQLSI